MMRLLVEISIIMVKIGLFQKIYLALVFAAMAAMLLPESRLSFNGQVYNTYMFTDYSVWVAFAPALVFMIYVSWCVVKNRQWPIWSGIIGALLPAGAALYRIIGFLQSNSQEAVDSLARKGNLQLDPGAGLWVWLLSGVLQIVVIYRLAGSRK